jgi:hypothetical protein
MLGAGEGVAKRIDVVAVALQADFDVDDLLGADLSYAPPYAPVYEAILLACQAAAAKVSLAKTKPAPISPLGATVAV